MARAADAMKRASILKTAFRVFGELGYRATTIKAIALRAGIAPGSVYTYFTDKDDLFRRTVEEGWSDFLARLEQIRTSDQPFTRKLATLVDTGFQALKESLPLMRGMLFEASQRKLVQEKLDKVCESVEKLLRSQGARPPIGAHWRKILKITVVGILFSAASAPPENTDEEIRALREAIAARLAELGKGSAAQRAAAHSSLRDAPAPAQWSSR